MRYRVEAVLQVGKNVVDVLRADGKANGVGLDALIGKLLRGKLAVRCCCGMDHEALYVGNVGKQGEYFQTVDEPMGFRLTALDLKGEDGAAAVREIFSVQRVVGVLEQRRVVDPLHLRMRREEFYDLLRVFNMTLYAERERLNALQKQKCRKGRDGRACIAEQYCADIGDECRRAGCFDEGHAVVARIRLCDGGVFSACRPVEFAGVHDDTAERRAVTAEKFGRGMYNDVCAVFNGAKEIRRAEGVVCHERNPVPVGKLRQRVDVRNVAVGVAERFNIDGARVVPNRRLDRRKIVNVNEACRDAEVGERMRQQIIAAAVDRLLHDEVTAVLPERLQRVVDRRCAGGKRQSRDAALKGCDASLQHVLRGVGQSAVDVACVGKAEAGGCMGAVAEHIGGRGVDGHRAGIGRGVGGFLTDMELQGFKFVI